MSITLQNKYLGIAAKSVNPIKEAFPDYSLYKNDDFEVSLYCKQKADMDSKVLKWAFKLAETNVGPFYKTCKLGWQPKIKQNELNKNWARYLVAVNSEKVPVAYAMFRFDIDYESCVLYCYELQIDKSQRRKGLGKFMMSALEKCAQHFNMEKVVLTVLKNNPDAMAFFRKIGYSVDDSSPDESEAAEYEILSKRLNISK